MNKKEEHSDFDKNIRNRVNSEQHVPPSHLWDKIEHDAKSYDDENFDQAIRSKIKKQKTIVPKELWPKINSRASRLIRKPYVYLKWAAIPVIVLLLFISKQYFTSNKETKAIENNNSSSINQNKIEDEKLANKSIIDTIKQAKQKENDIQHSENKKMGHEGVYKKKIDKKANDLSTVSNERDLPEPFIIEEAERHNVIENDPENLKSLKAYLKREQYGALDSLPHSYQNLEKSKIERLNLSKMIYFDKLKDSISGKDSISVNENITQNKNHNISKETNPLNVHLQESKVDSNSMTKIAESRKEIDSTDTNVNLISEDSTKIVSNKKDTTDSKMEKVAPIKSTEISTSLNTRKKFHASLYFSPTYVNSHINKGDEEFWKDEYGEPLMSAENNVDKNEYLKIFYRNKLKGHFGYNFGADFGYNFNNQLAINIGINYFNSKQVFYEQNASYYELPIRLNTSNTNTSNGTITSYNLTGTSNISSSTVDFYPDTLQDIDTNYYRYEYRETIERKYLNIPITLSYRFTKNRWSFLIEGGICAAFVYNSNYEIYLNQLNTEKEWERNPKAGRNFVLGTSIGLGMEYALNDKFSLLCMPNFNYSLSNINAENKFRVNPYALRISTGIRFRF
ncbi:MAG: hypothetical protein P8I93_01710 [Crocinitomicaceae bacterium]|nr:hypothetical protein [Crocinitomicaceae bacterium]